MCVYLCEIECETKSVCISETRKNLYNITENGKTIKFSILNENKNIETKIKYMEIVKLTEKRGKMMLGGWCCQMMIIVYENCVQN